MQSTIDVLLLCSGISLVGAVRLGGVFSDRANPSSTIGCQESVSHSLFGFLFIN